MNVFILGAGASVHAGYPLCNRLAPALKEWTIKNDEAKQHFGGLIETLEEKGDIGNLEVLLTNIVEGKIDFPGWGNFRGRLEYAIRHHFRHIRHSQPAKGYENFAKYHVRPGDVILTFNYDVASERELKLSGKFEAGDGYGFEIGSGLTPSSPVKVLKLHGSVNWIASIFGGLRGSSVAKIGYPSLGYRPVLPTDELEFLGFKGICDPEFKVGTGFVTPMILPTLSKQFYFATSLGIEWLGFWNSIWDMAQAALQGAEQAFLLGYSMPKADERATDLILGNIKKDKLITLCCWESNSNVSQQFEAAGFRHVRRLDEVKFEQWAAKKCA